MLIEKIIKYRFLPSGVVAIIDLILIILGEHYRLGSKSVILSRTFKGSEEGDYDFSQEIQKVRDKENEISNWNKTEFLENKQTVKEKVDSIVERIKLT